MDNELFNKLLYESIDNTKIDHDNTCLICLEPLEPDHVKLKCGHAFNYVPIFNEIRNQKNTSWYETTKLSKYQIKCPYCRNIQWGLIPTNNRHPTLSQKFVNLPKSQWYYPNTCKVLFKSGRNKNKMCNKKCIQESCKQHDKLKNKNDGITCNIILKTGKNKGNKCNNICKTVKARETHTCLLHLKYIK
jgi:hypothetical protein